MDNSEQSDYKEIIYLDQIELDSALAQLEKGLKESIVNGDVSTQQAGESTTIKGNMSGTLDGIFAKGTATMESEIASNESNSEGISKTINVVLNDYKIERLIKILDKTESITVRNSALESQDGEFILLQSEFRLTDFELFLNMITSNGIKKLMQTIPAENGNPTWNKGIENGFKLSANIAEMGKTLFQNNILISAKDSISYAERKNFRMNSGQLQLLSGTNRSIFILGIVESKLGTKKNDIDEVTQSLDLGLQELGNITSSLSELVLTSMGFAKENDRLIKPIAIYF